jgi:hypothetical protein
VEHLVVEVAPLTAERGDPVCFSFRMPFLAIEKIFGVYFARVLSCSLLFINLRKFLSSWSSNMDTKFTEIPRRFILR